jgi:tripartite-type tricarboxylate transporter receptor subunit TctC
MKRIAMVLALICMSAGSAATSDYPSRPIRFLQGFAAGGNADVISRVLAEEMSKTLGQSVISEPKPGAGGNLASDVTAKSAPDGYTIVLLTTGHVISPALYKSLSFDPVGDFEFVSTVTEFPFFIVVNANSPYKSIEDLVAAARSKAGSLTVGTAGVGTGQHMSSELLATSLGIKFVHVPFRGDSAAVTALLGGNVDFIIAPGTAILGNIEAGTLRALALSGAERWPSLPNVPTLSETVAKGLQIMAWAGVATTKGTPKEIVARLNEAVRKAIGTPNVSGRLKDLGGYPRSSSPEEMTSKVRSQIQLWKDVADKAGLEKQ